MLDREVNRFGSLLMNGALNLLNNGKTNINCEVRFNKLIVNINDNTVYVIPHNDKEFEYTCDCGGDNCIHKPCSLIVLGNDDLVEYFLCGREFSNKDELVDILDYYSNIFKIGNSENYDNNFLKMVVPISTYIYDHFEGKEALDLFIILLDWIRYIRTNYTLDNNMIDVFSGNKPYCSKNILMDTTCSIYTKYVKDKINKDEILLNIYIDYFLDNYRNNKFDYSEMHYVIEYCSDKEEFLLLQKCFDKILVGCDCADHIVGVIDEVCFDYLDEDDYKRFLLDYCEIPLLRNIAINRFSHDKEVLFGFLEQFCYNVKNAPISGYLMYLKDNVSNRDDFLTVLDQTYENNFSLDVYHVLKETYKDDWINVKDKYLNKDKIDKDLVDFDNAVCNKDIEAIKKSYVGMYNIAILENIKDIIDISKDLGIEIILYMLDRFIEQEAYEGLDSILHLTCEYLDKDYIKKIINILNDKYSDNNKVLDIVSIFKIDIFGL